MSVANVDDVAARLGRTLSPAESSQAAVLLDDVEAVIVTRYPTLALLNQQALVAVECYAVMRVLRNPDGKRQQSIDDYSWTTDTALSAGALYISDAEWAMLKPALVSSGEAFTIRPYYAPDDVQVPGMWT